MILRFCKYMNEHTSLNIESHTFLVKNKKCIFLNFVRQFALFIGLVLLADSTPERV